jgi:hypothetical protein
LTAAVGKQIVIQKLGVVMVKKPIDLQKPLDEFDETVLSPYSVKHKAMISGEVLESLGTNKYLQWTLENPDVESDSPLRYCSLFITYYTCNPDMVPHVPDECYVGGGKSRLSGETVKLEIPWPDTNDANKKIGLQYVLFGQTGETVIQNDITFSVQYLFHVNGKYTEDRTQTRLALGSNWKSKYSYFTKVEWSFFGYDSFGRIYADKEQTLQASEKLLSSLLPELEKEHWPDWQKVNAKDYPPDKEVSGN